jgi:hypothetical protein
MNWYYRILGSHAHIRCFMNGAHCGNLTLRFGEFMEVRQHCPWIAFIEEPKDVVPCAEPKESVFVK